MKRIIFVSIVFTFSLMSLVMGNAGAAMSDYCVVPPYVIQNTPPNIMIVADNSGSMFKYAYECPETTTSIDSPAWSTPIPPEIPNLIYVDSVDGFEVGMSIDLWDDYNNHLDINGDCDSDPNKTCYWNMGLVITSIDRSAKSLTVSGGNHYLQGAPVVKSDCASIPDTKQPGYTVVYDSTLTYYGYFNSNSWYTYASSGRFEYTDLKSDRTKASGEWDGNFLNWLTMRRVDVLKKVLTGGKTTSGGGASNDVLRGERPDWYGRGVYKTVTNAENYMPISGTNQTRCMYSRPGSSNPARFYYSADSSACSDTSDTRRNVEVLVPSPVEGVLQEVVGARARVGLTFFNVNSTGPQGAKVEETINNTSYTDTINKINNKRPNANTPLAETLWTVTGYFAKEETLESGPGPQYNNGDYPVTTNDDPYNYGTGGQDTYPKCAKSFVLFITDGEPCADGNLPSTIKNYAEGKSAYDCYDLSPGDPGRDGYCPSVGSFQESTFPSCNGGGEGGYVSGLEDVALYMHTTDLRQGAAQPPGIDGEQNLTLYTVFAFGKGSTLLRYATINGAFEDLNGNNIPDLQSEWDNNGDGEPDTFYEATEGDALEASIRSAFSDMLNRAASGTSASVLASGGGSGANILQAVYYPRRRFGNDILGWSGLVHNLWYYIDRNFTNSGLREDTVSDNILDLSEDLAVNLYFDIEDERTMAERCSDTDGDGSCNTTLTPDITFEELSSIWRAGELLWERVGARTIWTHTDGSTLIPFVEGLATATVLAPYLDAQDEDNDDPVNITDDADLIIRYIHGEDFKSTDVPIKLDLDGDTAWDREGDGNGDFRSRTITNDGNTNVWKLGDVINSTPRITSWLASNRYHYKFKEGYDDPTYGPNIEGYEGSSPMEAVDTTYYITSEAYKDRNMVYVGGNDGMLHAFRLGEFWPTWDENVVGGPGVQSDTEKAWLNGSGLGEEVWAFIPKNALPYLRYQKETDYCHIYTVDLSPFIFDASIGGASATSTTVVSDWRTILIGGMRFGGGCRKPGTCPAGDDCVETPILDPDNAVGEDNGLGYSSYFALDITNENVPELLWEFTDEELGFSTTGPAVVRVADSRVDRQKENGSWFVVFGSGPTGPIDTSGYQFMGTSDQNLKFFIFDLEDGPGANNVDVEIIDTEIANAFAGEMINATNDTDLDYQDDFLHIGYTNRTGNGTNVDPYVWDGGILRLVTNESSVTSGWTVNPFVEGVGPVTSAVNRLLDTEGNIFQGNVWVYFGTGRYFFDMEDEHDDPDPDIARRLFGVKDPCADNNGYTAGCITKYTINNLTYVGNSDTIVNIPTTTYADASPADGNGFKGWYIDLDSAGLHKHTEGNPPASVERKYFSERSITKPLTNTQGCVYFMTFKPYDVECAIGGKTFIWGAEYNTGDEPQCLGKLTFQVSTGAIEEEGLGGGGRRNDVAFEGKIGSEGGLNQDAAKAVKAILHKRIK